MGDAVSVSPSCARACGADERCREGVPHPPQLGPPEACARALAVGACALELGELGGAPPRLQHRHNVRLRNSARTSGDEEASPGHLDLEQVGASLPALAA